MDGSRTAVMFESRDKPLLPYSRFLRRLLAFLAIAVFLMFAALGLGTLGYHYIAGLSWIDAVLNAVMILTGMGPVNLLTDTPAKLFATAYALFSVFIVVSAIGLFLSPVFHRILHKFHLDDTGFDDDA
jgi:hypothetical protein